MHPCERESRVNKIVAFGNRAILVETAFPM